MWLSLIPNTEDNCINNNDINTEQHIVDVLFLYHKILQIHTVKCNAKAKVESIDKKY